MENAFKGIYGGRNVFVTGHTGFKGSWLSLWLQQMGAQVCGYAREPNTEPSHFELLGLGMDSVIGELADLPALTRAMQAAEPEIVFHLAAQALVRDAYDDPVETYSSNVMGTLNVLEAARQTPSVRAMVMVTTDKVYENREWTWGYRENDRLGGYDPYSSSKACAEILCASYRNSFWPLSGYGKDHRVLMSTARGGNVIGGGDWSKDRLIPDVAKATAAGDATVIRNPQSTRPWQHVLDCLSGYLLVGQGLLEERVDFADAYNFGPSHFDNLPVSDVAERTRAAWPKAAFEFPELKGQPHEAGLLQLDCAKARSRLSWVPVWDAEQAIKTTVSWYRDYYEQAQVRSLEDLQTYVGEAKDKSSVWA